MRNHTSYRTRRATIPPSWLSSKRHSRFSLSLNVWKDPTRNMSEFFDFTNPALATAPGGVAWPQFLSSQPISGFCDQTQEAGEDVLRRLGRVAPGFPQARSRNGAQAARWRAPPLASSATSDVP